VWIWHLSVHNTNELQKRDKALAGSPVLLKKKKDLELLIILT
jgi:hypothetical protein